MRDRLLKCCSPAQNSAKWRLWIFILAGVVVPSLVSGCESLPLPGQPQEVNLQMTVAPSSARNHYLVSGTTNLPDKTSITVAAIRYFSLPDSSGAASSSGTRNESDVTFTVLDYRSTTVMQGKWQAELTLQQQNTDGKGWEAWQMQQPRLALQPAATVSFVTTLTAADQLTPLEQQLAQKGFRLPRGMVRTTAEGQRYAEVSQTIALAPPNPDQQAAVVPEPHNYGWGDRYVLVKEPQNPTRLERPDQPQTDAPATPLEFMR